MLKQLINNGGKTASEPHLGGDEKQWTMFLKSSIAEHIITS